MSAGLTALRNVWRQATQIGDGLQNGPPVLATSDNGLDAAQINAAASRYTCGMKLRHQTEPGSVRVWLSGDLDAGQCGCLRAYWDRHIDTGAGCLDIDLTDLDDLDGQSVAVMVDIVRHALDGGVRVAVHRAPQMLAHTFYKIGLLSQPQFELIDPRQDEPYG